MRSLFRLTLLVPVLSLLGCLDSFDPSNQALCGGIAATPCDDGLVCVDDPSDDCDPNNGGADCGGICTAPEAPVACGGFADIPCEDGFVCVDDSSDDCDPNNGGADCSGVCVSGELGCGNDGDCGADERCDFAQINPICLYDIECGTCAPKEAPVACGGFGDIQCDEGFVCVDDPNDDCDPTNGGADCSGTCEPQ